MAQVQREFGDDDDGTPTAATSAASSSGEDYALVIGVNDYPGLRSLRGAIADARAFAAWLIDTDGGGLRREHVHEIVSTGQPLAPVGQEINDALEDIFLHAKQSGGRRFYFYFSGHGCVGDRANDLALCLANWSNLRRRAALSSEAWLDVVVRSGIFDEVAFFLDCCRVWTARAVGLPPHVDFAAPVKRARGTRVFLAYATEFQQVAVEVDASSEYAQLESRGIFTQALITGLRDAARTHDGTVTARSLKKYVEMATEHRARELGFYQRAEVLNGFDDASPFGSSRPGASGMNSSSTWDTTHDMGPSPYATSDTQDSHSEFAPEMVMSVDWLAAYMLLHETGKLEMRHAAGEDRHAASRFLLVALPREPRRHVKTTWRRGGWWLSRHDQTINILNENPKNSDRKKPLVVSARLPPGAYLLQHTGPAPRDIMVHLYDGWTTLIAIDDAFDPRFESARVFLLPGRSDDLPAVSQLDEGVGFYLALLNSSGFGPHVASYAMQFPMPSDNPMLGLLTAHLLARQNDPDAGRIDSIADQLESRLGACPDIDALRLRAALIRKSDLPRLKVTDPPMLREGLLAFVEASHRIPELIPSGSLFEHACIERLVDSPLSSWPGRAIKTDGDDWLTTSIEDLATQCGGDTTTLDAPTIARQLGVPTQAITTRIATTRRRSTTKVSTAPAVISTNTSSQETAPIPSSVPLSPRTPSIPGYQFERLIGKGGMGQVYLAKRVDTDTRVAVKVMQAQAAASKEARRRFLHEIDTMAVLRHDRIVGLLDHGDAHRCFYFAMKYYDQGNVADWVLRKGRPKFDVAVRLILDVLEGLAHAHERNYVHRDIKPQNILLDGRGGVVIADFGLAKCFEEAQLWDITKTGRTHGTVDFMPREQAVNFKRVRPATDVWAVAAVFYWLLCGCIPRDTSGSGSSFFTVLRNRVISIRERGIRLSPEVCDLLDRALSDDPQVRPIDAGAFRSQLEQTTGIKSARRG